MIIGVPKEIKNHEYRVGLTPAAVLEYVNHGHTVIVETQAGAGIGFGDEDYVQAGAHIEQSATMVFDKADMIVKVKEPQPNECKMLREGQILYTYLHLAPDPVQTQLLVESNATCIAYETVTDKQENLFLISDSLKLESFFYFVSIFCLVQGYFLKKSQNQKYFFLYNQDFL